MQLLINVSLPESCVLENPDLTIVLNEKALTINLRWGIKFFVGEFIIGSGALCVDSQSFWHEPGENNCVHTVQPTDYQHAHF